MKTQWRKMESWRPWCMATRNYRVIQLPLFRAGCVLRGAEMAQRIFRTRAAALRAANAANRRDGLPEVA